MQAGLVLTLLAVVAGGVWLYRAQAQAMRMEVERELTAIARLKAYQIGEWRADQLEDAASLQQDPYLVRAIAAFLAAPAQANRDDLLGRLRVLARQHDIEDILLVDTAARVLLRLGLLPGHPDQWYQPVVHQALAGRRPVFLDLHRGPLSDIPHSATVAPLFGEAGQGQQPLGCLVLVNGDSRFLFPLLQVWPTPSRTAETLLVRRDGDQALFLAATRHQADAALNLRLPLGDSGPVSVQAVQGRTGYVHGLDYRGVEVAAVLLPIDNTPWLMVVKIDRDEAFADWRLRSALLLALLGALAALVAIGGLLLWQRQEKAHFRALYQAEAATRAALEHRGAILEAVGDGVVAVNAEGRVDLLNPAANALTGWSGEQARGRLVEEVVDLVDTVTDAPLPNPARTALTSGGPVTPPDDQAILKARNGDRFQVAVAATPLPGGDGAVLAIRDMTQSSRLRATMRHERRILKLFVEHAPAAIAMFDREMRYLAVSRRFLVDHQLEGQDLIGQCHYDVFPDLPERWREANQRCLQGAVEGGSEDLWPRADGRTDWVRWAIHPWYEIGNQVGGLVLFSEVITARKETELALEASRRQLAHLFTVSPAVIYALRADSLEPTWVSPNVIDLLGYTVAEVLEPDWWVEHLHAGDRQRALVDMETLAAAGRVSHEYRFHRKDGSLLWVLDDLRLVRDESGQPTEIIGAWTDITHRREAEAALKRSEAKFRSLFQRHAAVKLLLDPDDGRILEANEAAAAFYGWSQDDAHRPDQHPAAPPGAGRTLPGVQPGAHLLRIPPPPGGRLHPRRGRVQQRHGTRGQAGDPFHCPRHHRVPPTRRAAPPGAEDGVHRPVGRRRGPRFQQHAGRDPRLHPARARPHAGGRPEPRGPVGGAARGRAFRRDHPPAARLCPAAARQPGGDRPEHGGGRPAQDARPAHRRGRAPGLAARRGPLAGVHGPGPVRPDARQPVHQRPRRRCHRRHHHHRDRPRALQPGGLRPPARPSARRLHRAHRA
jgi:PAS domain S-box-containing protein